jgi:hypothetical protein
MEFAMIPTTMLRTILVHVQSVSMALIANLAVDLVNHIFVSGMVHILIRYTILSTINCFPFIVGICNETSSTTFICTCTDEWEGKHCERKTNYCYNITCQNKGVCRPLLGNYTCECLGDSYYGRHCEHTAKRIIIYKIVSKSVSYVAIIVIASVAMFIVIMDILKYCFGIDPVHEERERLQRKKRGKKRKPVIQRFAYVNAPSN